MDAPGADVPPRRDDSGAPRPDASRPDAPLPGSSPRAKAARDLTPRVWAGEDIREDLEALLADARADDDPDGECACLFMRASAAAVTQDAAANREAAHLLITVSQATDQPVWESIGHHFVVYMAVQEGHEELALNSLVSAEVLTDGAGPGMALGVAWNGLAGAYSALDLFEDSERVYEQLSQLHVPGLEAWSSYARIYNRLVNQVVWVLALLRAGHEEAALERAAETARQVRRDASAMRGSDLWTDVLALRLFADLMTGALSPEDGRRDLTGLATRSTAGPINFVSFVHCALAHRFADAGDMGAAHEQIAEGFAAVDALEGDSATVALTWERARIASLEHPDHRGVADVWTYARRAAGDVWELRLRRREAVRDRLRIERLHVAHRTTERAVQEDPLTGVANRRRLEAEREALRREPAGSAVTVMYLDIDDFKGINDALGHQAGDDALQAFAALLVEHTREEDLVARYGGDEFVIISRGCGQVEAAVLTQRVLEAVRDHTWATIDPSLALRVSIGTATGDRDHDDLFGAADAALYRAKHAGRDQAHLTTIPTD